MLWYMVSLDILLPNTQGSNVLLLFAELWRGVESRLRLRLEYGWTSRGGRLFRGEMRRSLLRSEPCLQATITLMILGILIIAFVKTVKLKYLHRG